MSASSERGFLFFIVLVYKLCQNYFHFHFSCSMLCKNIMHKTNPFKSGRWRGGGIPLKSMSQKNLKMRQSVKNGPVQCLQTARLQFLIIVVQYTVNTDSAFARHQNQQKYLPTVSQSSFNISNLDISQTQPQSVQISNSECLESRSQT